jgi:hypothetical protein
MKRHLAGLVALGLAAFAWAQPSSVLLSNAENIDLHYVIDPPGLAGPDTSSAVFVGRVVSFLAETTPEITFRRLEPLGIQRVEGLSEGTHLFVGVFQVRGATGLPVRVIRLQAGGGIEERLYTIYREPATVLAKAGTGRLAGIGATDSGSGVASAAGAGATGGSGSSSGAGAIEMLSTFWRGVEPVVTFTGAFEPELVVRQTTQGSTIIPFARATFWGVDGVRLRELRLVRRPQELAFRVQTFGSMSANESLLLYLQEDRKSGADNRLTIELVPSTDITGGYVLMWNRGSSRPVIVGRFTQQGNILVGRIRYSDASTYVDLKNPAGDLTADVCTAHHEAARGVYEEFYHATIRLDDLPRGTDESPVFL